MCPSSSLSQWFCGDMQTMDAQWWSSHIVSVRTNRMLNQALGKEHKYINYTRSWLTMHIVLNKHKLWSIIHIYWSHEHNPMRPFSSSPQWLCGDMLAMESQWRCSCIFSARTNRVLNKHYARSICTLIIPETGSWHTECSTSTKHGS